MENLKAVNNFRNIWLLNLTLFVFTVTLLYSFIVTSFNLLTKYSLLYAIFLSVTSVYAIKRVLFWNRNLSSNLQSSLFYLNAHLLYAGLFMKFRSLSYNEINL